MKYNKSEIMKHAWRLFRAVKAGTMKWAEALRRAWQYAKDAMWGDMLSFDTLHIPQGEPAKPKTDDDRYFGAYYAYMANYRF